MSNDSYITLKWALQDLGVGRNPLCFYVSYGLYEIMQREGVLTSVKWLPTHRSVRNADIEMSSKGWQAGKVGADFKTHWAWVILQWSEVLSVLAPPPQTLSNQSHQKDMFLVHVIRTLGYPCDNFLSSKVNKYERLFLTSGICCNHNLCCTATWWFLNKKQFTLVKQNKNISSIVMICWKNSSWFGMWVGWGMAWLWRRGKIKYDYFYTFTPHTLLFRVLERIAMLVFLSTSLQAVSSCSWFQSPCLFKCISMSSHDG